MYWAEPLEIWELNFLMSVSEMLSTKLMIESIEDALKYPTKSVSRCIFSCLNEIYTSSEVKTNRFPITLKTGSISNIFEPNPTVTKERES